MPDTDRLLAWAGVHRNLVEWLAGCWRTPMEGTLTPQEDDRTSDRHTSAIRELIEAVGNLNESVVVIWPSKM